MHDGMIAEGATHSDADAAETLLRAHLAREDAVLASIDPVLRHLLSNDDHSIFSEEIVARTRGMIAALAAHLMHEVWASGRRPASAREDVARLNAELLAQPELLSHCHALALEGQLSDRLAARARMDPVLSPLLEARLASAETESATLAMKLLAAQTRFMQGQRRMDIVLDELPADLLHGLLTALDTVGGSEVAPVTAGLRARYDEARSRLGLLTRLTMGLGPDQAGALNLGGAGVAIFVTALSLAAMQERSRVILALTEGQPTRLSIMLAAAGLSAPETDATLALIHQDVSLPRHHIGLERGQALMLLSGGDQA